jgi:hypothetical protein
MATSDVRVHELGFLRTKYFLAQWTFSAQQKHRKSCFTLEKEIIQTKKKEATKQKILNYLTCSGRILHNLLNVNTFCGVSGRTYI